MKSILSAVSAVLVLSMMFVGATTNEASADTTSIKRNIVDRNTGEVLFRCGDIYTHRIAGVVRPGGILVNQAPVVPVAPLHRYSKRMQSYILACNANHTLYAGHTQPMVGIGIGIGINKQIGGGDTNLYGSQAYSGSNSGAVSNAGATSR